MKKLLAMFTALLILAMPVMAADAGGNLGAVPYTEDEIVIDGVKDEIYEKALVVDVDQKASGEGNDFAKGVAYLLRDKDTLYVLVEVTGESFYAKATADIQANTPWGLDSVEVFTNEKNDDQMPNVLQHRIDTTGWPTAYKNDGSLTNYGPDKANANFEWGVADVTSTGYVTEFAIPYTANKLGFNIQINDMIESGGQYTISLYSESKKGATAPWEPKDHPYITMDGAEVFTVVEEAAAATETATSTADFVTISALAAVVSLAGAFISKKSK